MDHRQTVCETSSSPRRPVYNEGVPSLGKPSLTLLFPSSLVLSLPCLLLTVPTVEHVVFPGAQSCLTLWDPTDSGSSVHGIFQARLLEWAATSYSTGSSWPRDWSCVSCLLHWQADSSSLAPPGKPHAVAVSSLYFLFLWLISPPPTMWPSSFTFPDLPGSGWAPDQRLPGPFLSAIQMVTEGNDSFRWQWCLSEHGSFWVGLPQFKAAHYFLLVVGLQKSH